MKLRVLKVRYNQHLSYSQCKHTHCGRMEGAPIAYTPTPSDTQRKYPLNNAVIMGNKSYGWGSHTE